MSNAPIFLASRNQVRTLRPAPRPAGQAAPAEPAAAPDTTAAPEPASPAPAPAPPTPMAVSLNPDGTIAGIEPILQQISTAVAGAAGQLFETRVWPIIQRDTALQREVGAAAGRAAAAQLRPWIIVGVAGITVIAGIKVWRLATGRYGK